MPVSYSFGPFGRAHATREQLISDTAANDSDKSFTVPDGEVWNPTHLTATLVTSADPGNRQLVLEIKDADGNVVVSYAAGAVQADVLTRTYQFGVAYPNETGFTGGVIQHNIVQDLLLPAGYVLRVYDSAAIAAAADDLTVRALGDLIQEAV